MLKILQSGVTFSRLELQSSNCTRKLVRICKNHLKTTVDLKDFSCNVQNTNSTINLIEECVKKLRIYDEIDLPAAELNWNYLLDESNSELIEKNYLSRKGHGDIKTLHQLHKDLRTALSSQSSSKSFSDLFNEQDIHIIIEKMYEKASEIPNSTHPSVPAGNYENSKSVLEIGNKIEKKTPTIDQISKLYGWLKEDSISLYSVQRAYILRNELADLESALIKYTLNYLSEKGFVLVSVPDILHHSIIESCGFPTKGIRNQVYKLDYLNEYGKYCLAGTSEMALGGLLKNRVFNEKELPLKLCAVSRCYRAEVSGSEKEGKLYRLHEFTKVEMFILTLGNTEVSNKMLEEIKSYQVDLFSNLNLNFKVLDMSSEELGFPAYRKYDIEAWMPGNQFYGEISSTSNCTDFQSRRLHIKSKNDTNDSLNFVHTLNGTACAIPRMLTCIIESNWDMENKQLIIPNKLIKYMNNREVIKVPKDFRKAEPLRHFK